MKTPTQSFKDALQRLVREMSNLRSEHAAIAAHGEVRPAKSRFLFIAYTGLLNARQLRLVRVFEDSNKTASFWYLHRCALKLIEKNLDIARLREFSRKLKKIRNASFVHLDKEGAFDLSVYREADIRPGDILYAVDAVWPTVRDLYAEVFGEPPLKVDPSLDELIRLLKESLSDLIEHG